MTTITIDNITYTFTKHGLRRMNQEDVKMQHVELAIADPDRIEPSADTAQTLYIKAVPRHKRPLMVVVDEDDQKIVTAYWNSPFR